MQPKDLMGEWRLLSATLTVAGEDNSILDPNRHFIKLFTASHFAFFSLLLLLCRMRMIPSNISNPGI